jgi:phage-related protein
MPKFKVVFLEEAVVFLNALEEKVRDKIIYNITKAQYSSDKELFKKLTDEIWEFRTMYQKTHYRLFAFWDKSQKTKTLVIATHGLIKKSDKIPQGDLNKTERMRRIYFESKEHKK